MEPASICFSLPHAHVCVRVRVRVLCSLLLLLFCFLFLRVRLPLSRGAARDLPAQSVGDAQRTSPLCRARQTPTLGELLRVCAKNSSARDNGDTHARTGTHAQRRTEKTTNKRCRHTQKREKLRAPPPPSERKTHFSSFVSFLFFLRGSNVLCGLPHEEEGGCRPPQRVV